MATCEIYQEAGALSGWRWRLVAKNNKIVADSGEAYSTKSKAREAFIRMANLAEFAKVKYI